MASTKQIVEKAQDAIGNGHKMGQGPVRYILFHSPVSVCSEKVRAVLGEVGVGYIAHDVVLKNPFAQNYHPDYVALRLLARPEGAKLVGGTWTGSSSTAETGYDPCVVPTLVDLGADPKCVEPKVIVDSKVICEYIVAQHHDSAFCWTASCPAAQRVISKHLDFVDQTPHVAQLYDGNPEKDQRPLFLRNAIGGGSLHLTQIEALEARLGQKGKEWSGSELEEAYKGKLAKTRAGQAKTAETIRGDLTYLNDMMVVTRRLLAALEEDLTQSTGEWLCGEQFSMADLMWGVSLFRMQLIGNSYLWDNLPKTKAFAERVYSRQSLQDAVIFYPGMLPSHHAAELHTKYRGAFAGFAHHRLVNALDVTTTCSQHKMKFMAAVVAAAAVAYMAFKQ